MCTYLGANFYYEPNFKPYFINPITKEECFVFLDYCYMIKLVRNTLGDKKILKTQDGHIITWNHIKNLHEFQQEEGLRPANKLTNKHIQFQNNRMDVKLAIQTLSKSVYKSFIFLMNLPDKNIPSKFLKCFATANFCLQFNNIGDVLNCKNKFSKDEFNTPLIEDNYLTMQMHAKNFEQ